MKTHNINQEENREERNRSKNITVDGSLLVL
jgi:hypothetical protein